MSPRFHNPGDAALDRNRCIVSCGIGAHYAAGLAKLREACAEHCPDVWQLFYDDYPDGCPPQAEMMYAFKIYAIREAVKAGFRYILWMDAAFQPVADIEPLWDAVERFGWYVPPQEDAMLGHWCSDDALAKFGITRDEACRIPLVYSGLVGLDLGLPAGLAIWLEWERLYQLGTFNGPHQNIPGAPMEPWGQKWNGHCSLDLRVYGHRHDESALSYALASMHLIPQKRGFLKLESPNGFIGHHMERMVA